MTGDGVQSSLDYTSRPVAAATVTILEGIARERNRCERSGHAIASAKIRAMKLYIHLRIRRPIYVAPISSYINEYISVRL